MAQTHDGITEPGAAVIGPVTIQDNARVSCGCLLCGSLTLTGGLMAGFAQVFCDDRLPHNLAVTAPDHAFYIDGLTGVRTLDGMWLSCGTISQAPADLQDFLRLRLKRWRKDPQADTATPEAAVIHRPLDHRSGAPRHIAPTGDIKMFRGRQLRRIKATQPLPHLGLPAGARGGWVENLGSIHDNAWVADQAIVMDAASIFNNAVIAGRAVVCGVAEIAGDSRIGGDCFLGGYGHVHDAALCSTASHIFHISGLVALSPLTDATGFTAYRTTEGFLINDGGWVTSSLSDLEESYLSEAPPSYIPELSALFAAVRARIGKWHR